MSRSVNRVVLLGNVGKDPDLKYTPQGTPVAKFSLATNERYKDKDGNWQERAEWHNIVLWQRLAEIAGEYLKKGSKVYIEGRLRTESWEDKQSGQKKYMTTIVGSDIVLLGAKDGAGDESRPKGSETSRSGGAGPRPVTSEDPATDEDVPFILYDGSCCEEPLRWRKRKYV